MREKREEIFQSGESTINLRIYDEVEKSSSRTFGKKCSWLQKAKLLKKTLATALVMAQNCFLPEEDLINCSLLMGGLPDLPDDF